MKTTTVLHLLSRYPSHPWRALPDFIVIGAQKSGTTALYDYLSQHPACVPALKKETHFFDVHHARGLGWYRAYFPLKRDMQRVSDAHGTRAITGEATPYYLFHPHVRQRIHAVLPGVKLIVLLRNPVDRAYSHYQHQVQRGREPLAFEQAIDEEINRTARDRAAMQSDPHANPSRVRHYSYLARGVYADQLAQWLGYFPRERLFVASTEDLRADTAGVFGRVLEFLGLPPFDLGEYPLVFKGSYGDMQPETRARLHAYFAPHNQRLYDLLACDLGWTEQK